MRNRTRNILRRLSGTLVAAIYEATRTYTGIGDFTTDAGGWNGATLPTSADDWVIDGDGSDTGAAQINDGESASFNSLTIDPNHTGANLSTNGTCVLNGRVICNSTAANGVNVNGVQLIVNGDQVSNFTNPSSFQVPVFALNSGTLTINGAMSGNGNRSSFVSLNSAGVSLVVNGAVSSSSEQGLIQGDFGCFITINGNVSNDADAASNGGIASVVYVAVGAYVKINGDMSNTGVGSVVYVDEGGILDTVSNAGRMILNTGAGTVVNNAGGLWLAGDNDTISDPNLVAGNKLIFPRKTEVVAGIDYYDGSLEGTYSPFIAVEVIDVVVQES